MTSASTLSSSSSSSAAPSSFIGTDRQQNQKSLRVICWNLEKRSELIDWVFRNKQPHVALFQEWVGQALTDDQHSSQVSLSSGVRRITVGTSSLSMDIGVAASFEVNGGVAGTSIMAPKITKFCSAMAPKGDYRLQFWKGMIHKATSIAQLDCGLTMISFHGYNGTFQGRQVDDLIDHVDSVMKVMKTLPNPDGPVVWAGDFNSFTFDHVIALEKFMFAAGFNCDWKVPYDSKKILDFVFTRQCSVKPVESGTYMSDHPFLLFDVTYVG
jgi:hypothetical protein